MSGNNPEMIQIWLNTWCKLSSKFALTKKYSKKSALKINFKTCGL